MEAEAQLAAYKHALDQAAIVAITDVKGRITYVNDTFCSISGYSRDELVGQDHRLLNSGHHPSEFIRELWRTIAAGNVWRGDIKNRAKDGSYYWVDTTIVPFLNAANKPVQYLAIRTDVTERKANARLLQEQNSIARLGMMAAVVAHEVKNPLAGICGAIQVIANRRSNEDPERRILEQIRARAEALNQSLVRLLQFARPRQPKRSLTRLREVVTSVFSVVADEANTDKVEFVVTGDPAPVMLDGALLGQAMLNLVRNAVQAMEREGRVTVDLHEHSGKTAKFDVWDTGPGFGDSLDQVFMPFFTSKTSGTGLGLAIVEQTINLHGGEIVALEHPGGGALFSITLPIAVPAS